MSEIQTHKEMQLISAIIRGNDNLYRYCEKRFHEAPRFMETIGKVANAKVYLRYWHAPGDNGYHDYYILIMEDNERGKYYSSHDQVIKESRELVETGRARLLTA